MPPFLTCCPKMNFAAGGCVVCSSSRGTCVYEYKQTRLVQTRPVPPIGFLRCAAPSLFWAHHQGMFAMITLVMMMSLCACVSQECPCHVQLFACAMGHCRSQQVFQQGAVCGQYTSAPCTLLYHTLTICCTGECGWRLACCRDHPHLLQ